MSPHESLKRAVEADVTAFEDRHDEILDNLSSSDTQKQIDAGRAVRVAAETDPSVVEPYLETLVELLTSQHDSIKLSGAIGLAELAAEQPSSVADATTDLAELLAATHAPAIEEAALRALTRIGLWSPDAVAAIDDITADHLRNATIPVRTAILNYFSEVVVESPSQFPATIEAIEAVLDDDMRKLRHRAGIVLTDIVERDPTAVSSVSDVHRRVESMAATVRAQPLKRGESIVDAAAKLRSLQDTDS